MARSTKFCVDGLIELHTNHTCALVFEKVRWLIEDAPDADDYTYQQNGQRWQEFTYAHLLKFFNLEINGEVVGNILKTERTLRRAIKELAEVGLIITRRCQRGIALAVNHRILKKFGGGEACKSDLPKVDTQEISKTPDLPKLDTQNPPRLTTIVQSDLPKVDTQPIYKELDSLEESQKENPLPDAKASDVPTATKVSTKSPEYKAIEAAIKAKVYNGGSLDMQGGILCQYLVIQKATPETLQKFIQWWRGQFPNAAVPRQIQRTKGADTFQGKFVTRWEEWQIAIKPKPKPIREAPPPLPELGDSQRRAQADLLRKGKPIP